MAQGDVITGGSYLANQNQYTMQPSSGVEWCVTGYMGSNYAQVFWCYSANTLNTNNSGNYQSSSGATANASSFDHPVSHFFSNTWYFAFKANTNGAHYAHFSGIQSK